MPARTPSVALPASTATALGAQAQLSLERLALHAGSLPAARMPDGEVPGLSGFRLLPLGPHALDARLQLIAQAQSSIDLQAYHLADDSSGRAVLRALRDAAGRGVRVRVLLDDLLTGGDDALWLAFAAHRGVEVRLFNPFTLARASGPVGRFLAAPWAWGRINHRMHNKLLLADGAWALFGGRNVADAYHLRQADDNFVDVDVLAAGALLGPLQQVFDRYWNAGTAYPLQSIVSADALAADLADGPHGEHRAQGGHTAWASSPDASRQRFEDHTRPAAHAPPMPPPLPEADVLGQPPVGALLGGAMPLALVPGRARVLADDPDKPFHGGAAGGLMRSSVTFGVYQALGSAQRSVVAVSPYVIPGRDGQALLLALRRRGVQVQVLTNSLASTDEPLVHLAYARYRPALLAAGVELFELSRRRVKTAMPMALFSATLGRLHTKTLVIDERLAFVGSMNLDPRSATLNTEFGALIDSPALAGQLRQLIDIDRVHGAYALRLSSSGGCCEWLLPEGDGSVVLRLEPDARWWMRWLGSLLQPLAPEDHL